MAQDKRPSDRVASDAGKSLRLLQALEQLSGKKMETKEGEFAASILSNREPKKVVDPFDQFVNNIKPKKG